jgi:asparagine synthase (glutamine-hydrolysing)
VKNVLPNEIMHRKKQGFSVPLAYWLKNDLREFAQETLFCGNGIGRDCFERSYLSRLWQMHMTGMQDNSTQLWALMMLELWAQQFAKVSVSQP